MKLRAPSGQEGDKQRKGCQTPRMAPNNQECADQLGGDSAEQSEGIVWPRPGLGALRGLNRQKGTGSTGVARKAPSTQEGVEQRGGRIFGGRGLAARTARMTSRAPGNQERSE